MANGDDGFSEVGGGGSVVYEVKVSNGNTPAVVPPTGPKRPHKVNGKDEYNETAGVRRYFKVEVKPPVAAEFVAGIWRLYVEIAPNYDPHQIKVSWALSELPEGLRELTLGAPFQLDRAS